MTLDSGAGAMSDQGDSQGLVLSEQVRLVLRQYFAELDGCQPSALHAFVIGEVERPLIETVLEHCGHNQSRAAEMLGLSRSTLRKKMAHFGII